MSDVSVLEKAKEKTKELIELGEIELAKRLVEQYKELLTEDVEVYSIRAVIAMIEGKMEEAEEILLAGYKIDDCNFDILYNLAFLYESIEMYNKSLVYYKKAKLHCPDIEVDKELENKINNLKNDHRIDKTEEINKKNKVVFFVKRKMDTFLNDIIDNLSKDYDIKKVIITATEEFILIDQWMEWADICWFEWCDELIVYGSRLPIAKERKILCRLHSYEAFTSYPKQVMWDTIDKVIFISRQIQNFVVENHKLDIEKSIVIFNGVNLDSWVFNDRKPGFKVAYVGYINYKKGSMLLLHTFKAIYDKDNRYKFHIAGKFQDDRDVLYFKQMIKEFGMEDNVFFEGWQDNLDIWLEDKSYIICTSVLESQNMSVMQAMAKGIKPIIHNFVGSGQIYKKDYIWNTIDEAVEMILDKNYNSREYRKFIEKNYALDIQMEKIDRIMSSLITDKDRKK